MRKIFFAWGLLSLLLLCLACRQEERLVKHPVFSVRTTNLMEIEQVVLNDTATVFYMDISGYPGQEFSMSPDAYLKAGDQKYPLVKAQYIPLGKNFQLPDSGKISFCLFFPVLPHDIKKVDFVEGDRATCFNIYDVELGSDAFASKGSDLIPEELKRPTLKPDQGLPEPDWTMGRTKLNMHLVGYRKELGLESLRLWLADFLTANQKDYTAAIDTNGYCCFEFDQYGTNVGRFDTKYFDFTLVLCPGEEIDVYVDLPELFRRTSDYLKVNGKDKPTVYCSGKYGELNRQSSLAGDRYAIPLLEKEFVRGVYGMNPDQYVDHVMQLYRALADSISHDAGLTTLQKELILVNNRAEVMQAIGTGPSFLQMAYRIVNEVYYEEKIDYVPPVFTDQQYKAFRELGIHDSKMLFSGSFALGYPCTFLASDLQAILGTEKGLILDLLQLQGMKESLEESGCLTEEQTERLKGMDNSFYQQAFQTLCHQKAERNALNQKKMGYNLREVPKVSNEQLLQAILARYKGKVVFVDFWATWCPPCRAAIHEMEPMKEKDLLDDQIVFVYITGESSPLGTWKDMIFDIRGEHYRLKKEQWEYICRKYEIGGIPSYGMADKRGNYTMRPDFFHNPEGVKTVLLHEKDRN